MIDINTRCIVDILNSRDTQDVAKSDLQTVETQQLPDSILRENLI